jgi:ABC-type sugar transport system ATPase subunit
MGELTLKDLTIRYDGRTAVAGFNLAVADGEMVSILGPSGAGKTTLLKAVAGLIKPAAGDVCINGRSLTGVPPDKRDTVMVFQKPLLFPFMNVEQNIAFGLRMAGCPAAGTRETVRRIAGLTRLEGLTRRKVHEISSGQQQRVSLARALVLEPAVLLLDEPLSSLDANLRQEMRELIQEIQHRMRITTLFVTHDQSEALMMSHRVSLILEGRQRQVGSPRDLFHRPVDPEVARFFGGVNFFEGRLRDGVFESELGAFAIDGISGNGHRFTATIRPEDVLISRENHFDLEGRVVKTGFEGSVTRVWVAAGTKTLVVLTTDADYQPGQPVRLRLPAEKIRVFPPKGVESVASGGRKKLPLTRKQLESTVPTNLIDPTD